MTEVYQHVTLVQLKEVKETFKSVQRKYENELKLYATREQREFNQKYVDHYNKEIAKIDKKIAKYPFI